MTPDNHPTRQEVLGAFAVEACHDRATLEKYLRAYPDYAEDLIDLSHELDRDVHEDEAPLSARDAALIDAAWLRHIGTEIKSISDPFAAMSATDLRNVALQLDIPRQVMAAFQEGRVLLSSVPRLFLTRMARAINSTVDILQRWLESSTNLELARSYKAEVKPSNVGQVSFERLLIEAGIPEDKRTELLSDGE